MPSISSIPAGNIFEVPRVEARGIQEAPSAGEPKCTGGKLKVAHGDAHVDILYRALMVSSMVVMG